MPDVTTTAARWAIVVPVKRLGLAKTRLSGDPDVRAALALAMAADTVQAALLCRAVDAVVVVTDEPVAARAMTELGATVVADAPDAGLNPALEHGARECARIAPRAGVAAVASDLPALRAESLYDVLTRAGAHVTAVVADMSGTGTTVYTAREGAAFHPRFGTDSRAAHVEAGATDLTSEAPADVRRDVDIEDDLREAMELGCGRSTTEALRGLPRS
jgi:2-phospho-L-lactate/phosphoenolpyruvate guanylyltransferase